MGDPSRLCRLLRTLAFPANDRGEDDRSANRSRWTHFTAKWSCSISSTPELRADICRILHSELIARAFRKTINATADDQDLVAFVVDMVDRRGRGRPRMSAGHGHDAGRIRHAVSTWCSTRRYTGVCCGRCSPSTGSCSSSKARRASPPIRFRCRPTRSTSLAMRRPYGISLMVLGMSLRWRAGAALLKGTAMGAFGIWVLGASAYHIVYPALPSAGIMSGVGVLALVAIWRAPSCSRPLPPWRCQRALGVAVYAQRCDRQHRRRRSRRRGVRHRHRLARPWRRCGHGGAGAFEFVPRIAPRPPGSSAAGRPRALGRQT